MIRPADAMDHLTRTTDMQLNEYGVKLERFGFNIANGNHVKQGTELSAEPMQFDSSSRIVK